MALKPSIDKLEDVGESFRELYTEGEDGKFHLDLDGDLYTDDDIANLKSALDKERKARREADKKAKAAVADTLTEEERKEFEELRQKEKATETKRLESKGEYEKLIKKEREEHAAELEKIRSELGGQLSEEKERTKRLYVRDKLRGAAVEAGILKESVEDVLTLTQDHFDLRDDEIVVLDDEGELSADSVSDFFTKTFKEQRPLYYQPSSDTGGSGTQPTTQTRTSHRAVVLSYEEARDPEKYRQGKALAAERGVPFEVEEPPPGTGVTLGGQLPTS
jgi:hypothetical protein